MKRVLAIFLVLCLAFGLCACSKEAPKDVPKETQPTDPPKSAEAVRADELIMAIGEVTADSEAAISEAQAYYDSLTQEKKAEVENYAILEKAQKLLPDLVLAAKIENVKILIDQGSCIEASIALSELGEIAEYEELMMQCGMGCIADYATHYGAPSDNGTFFLALIASTDNFFMNVTYTVETNSLQFVRYETSYGTTDTMLVDYVLGASTMSFARSTMQYGTPRNYQEGNIDIGAYTGGYTGSLADNSSEPLVILGLTETKVQSLYGTQTRGFKIGTMNNINEMLDALFAQIADAGFTGSAADMGFSVYKLEQ